MAAHTKLLCGMDVKCVTCSLLYVYLTAQASAFYSTTAGCAAEQALSVGDRTSCCFSSESPGLAAVPFFIPRRAALVASVPVRVAISIMYQLSILCQCQIGSPCAGLPRGHMSVIASLPKTHQLSFFLLVVTLMRVLRWMLCRAVFSFRSC